MSRNKEAAFAFIAVLTGGIFGFYDSYWRALLWIGIIMCIRWAVIRAIVRKAKPRQVKL